VAENDSYSKSRLNQKLPTMQGPLCKNGWDFPEFQIIFVKERLWTKSTSHGLHQARSMVDQPPWPAMELPGARPMAAPIAEGAFQWHREVEGRTVKLTSGVFWRWGWRIGLAARLCNCGRSHEALAVLGARSGRDCGGKGCGSRR
jgi:hypothetical protein